MHPLKLIYTLIIAHIRSLESINQTHKTSTYNHGLRMRLGEHLHKRTQLLSMESLEEID